MERRELMVWGEQFGQLATELVHVVHEMNDLEHTPAVVALQRSLVEVAVCCWGLSDRFAQVSRSSTNGASSQRT